MKLLCPYCKGWRKFELDPFTLAGNDITSSINCNGCGITLLELIIDEDEWQEDDEPEGVYQIVKITDYYPNGG